MTAPALTETCPSCGGIIDAVFCEICGERRPSERIYTLRAFLHEAFEVVTNVERSFLKTLWTLIRKPGELTAAYMRGERVRYLRPLQLFALVNVIYFFWAGATDVHVFNTRYHHQVEAMPYRERARSMVRARMIETGLQEEQLAKAFDARTLVLARSLVIAMVPAFALAVGLVSLRRRNASPVQHLVFSLHFYSAVLLMAIAVLYVAWVPLQLWTMISGPDDGWQTEDTIGSIIAIAMLILYLVPALRRAYGDGRIAAILKTVVLLFAFYYGVVAFRFLLLTVALAQIS